MTDDRPKKRSWKSRMVSAFDGAAEPVKAMARSSQTMEVFDEVQTETLIENSGAILKQCIRDGGPKNQGSAALMEQYQALLNAKHLSVKDRLKLVQKLDLAINAYAVELANDRQEVYDLQQSFDSTAKNLEGAGVKKLEMVTPLFVQLEKAEGLLKSVKGNVEHIGRLGDADRKDIEVAQALLGVINKAAMGSFYSSEAMARVATVEERAIRQPKSDAARLQAALGPMLRTYGEDMFKLERSKGLDFSKLGEHEALSEEEQLGLYLYTENDFESMNQLLIFGDNYKGLHTRESVQTRIDLCTRGLRKLPNYPRMLYPVVRWENENYDWRSFYKVNQVFHNMQFWSTGATAGAAIGKQTPVRLIFRIYGETGKDVAMISSKQGEGANHDKNRPEAQLKGLGKGEVLFAPNTPFKVMSINEEPQPNDRTFVYITVMEQAQ